MTSNAILRRIEKLEQELASNRHPKLLFVWTKSLADRISKVLPGYIPVSIHGITGCADDDAVEALVRQDAHQSERLDKLLAGIVPD
jgi:hypothetical protein